MLDDGNPKEKTVKVTFNDIVEYKITAVEKKDFINIFSESMYIATFFKPHLCAYTTITLMTIHDCTHACISMIKNVTNYLR